MRYDQAGPLRRLGRRSASVRPLSWLYARLLPSIDRRVFRLTGGRLLPSAALTGLPVVLLTTTGATSGLPRTVPLVGLPTNGRLAVIASNFGSPHHPAWYRNLRQHPDAEVLVDGSSYKVRAREVEGAERAEIWAAGVAVYPGWQAYARTAGDRRIPVIVLEPRS